MEDKLKKLTAVQFNVTQNNGTEQPFENEYWNFFEKGLYVDILSGEALFSSVHKFESLCGWPSFFKLIDKENVIQVEDHTHGMSRVEVRSKSGDCHLGHVFTDGPAPTGLRYCINSAALEFIPFSELIQRGYERYVSGFESETLKPGEPDVSYAYFGAGCFWGVEAILSKVPGVLSAVSGYAGGVLENPTYDDICTGESGHAEVVEVKFDKKVITFSELLGYFWRLHDPTTLNRQGYDSGTQYRSAIFIINEEQREVAQSSKKNLNLSSKWKDPITTEIESLIKFYPAEEYHQNYYDKKYAGGAGPICHFLRDE